MTIDERSLDEVAIDPAAFDRLFAALPEASFAHDRADGEPSPPKRRLPDPRGAGGALADRLDGVGSPSRKAAIALFLTCVALALFGIVAMRLTVAKHHVERARTELDQARRAALRRDIPASQAALDRAGAGFADARASARSFPLNVLAPVPLIGSPAKAVTAVTRAGDRAVAAGRLVDEAVANFPTSATSTLDGHDLSPFHAAAVRSAEPLRRASEELAAARKDLDGPAGAFLPWVSSSADQLQASVASTTETLRRGADALDLFAQLSDPASDTRILILSQDTLELRATGGFIGSFGVLHIAGGKVSLERYDSFDQLPPASPAMTPPERLAAGFASEPGWTWGLSNVNWWPNFPFTAAQAKEMFQRQQGGPVDGVVAMTERTIQRLIEVFGPVKLPSYDKPVGADGFEDRLVYEVELKRPLDTPRKKFLSELARAVIDRSFDLHEGEVPKVADALAASVGAGDVQAWFAAPDREAKLAGTVIAGELPVESTGDFVGLVDSNLSASKANQGLVKQVSYRVTRDPGSGHLIGHLDVVYKNTAPESATNPYYEGYLRVYVPKGAVLLDDGDVSTTEESDAEDGPYHVFAAEVQVAPLGTEVESLVYRLPDSVEKGGYRLSYLRQAGTPDDTFVAVVGQRRYAANPAGRLTVVDAGVPRNPLVELLHGRSPL